MSYAQNYHSLLEPETRRDGTNLLNGRDIQLEYLEPVHIPPSNDDPSTQRAYQSLPPPDQSPDSLDERLYDELCKGVYECPICTDTIELENQMWSCKDCHHIYHFPCAKEWALKRKDGSTARTWRWPCPTCKRLQTGGDEVMTPACWCGRWHHHHVEVIGNSCGRKCPGYNTCESPGAKCERFCQKLCHPGPCDPVVCVASCMLVRFPHFKTGKKAVKNVYQTPQQPRARAPPYRISRRERDLQVNVYRAGAEREAAAARRVERPARQATRGLTSGFETLQEGETTATVLMLGVLAGIETGMWCWIMFHIERWKSPLQHKHFTDHTRSSEFFTGIFAGGILLTILKVFVAGFTFYQVAKCLVHHLRLPRIGFGRPFVVMLMILATAASFFDFLVGYLAGPNMAWNAQMRTSCEGFETRVKLDGIDGQQTASSNFFLYEPIHSIQAWDPVPRAPGLDTFDIKKQGTDEMVKATSEPFTSYHRLSGAYTQDNPILIDFDLRHYTWRIMTPSNSTTPELLVRNGTWTNTTKSHPHGYFPELNLQVTNLHFFRKSCFYQPFVTIFRTDGMDTQAINVQSDRVWQSKSEDNVVMRTASFGAGQQHLEVCARRKDYDVLVEGNETETRKGLNEDVIVPLGLLSVIRRQMRMEKRLSEDCWWSKN
ncbi:hypothetical protein N431DRAFT_341086 [Stipitochalara longipes BDJ]|nr:hypothetical protein N431DRAFT_341086 [Stipitochalara longipes BDJ]